MFRLNRKGEPMKKTVTSIAAVLLLAGSLAACGDKREAESKTATTEAEVETTAPATAVSDAALQGAADQAAAAAAAAPAAPAASDAAH